MAETDMIRLRVLLRWYWFIKCFLSTYALGEKNQTLGPKLKKHKD